MSDDRYSPDDFLDFARSIEPEAGYQLDLSRAEMILCFSVTSESHPALKEIEHAFTCYPDATLCNRLPLAVRGVVFPVEENA